MPECKTSVPGWSPDYEFDPLVEGPDGKLIRLGQYKGWTMNREQYGREIRLRLTEWSLAHTYEEALLEWRYSGRCITKSGDGHCELCGNAKLVYLFEIVSTTGQKPHWLGSECIQNYRIAGALQVSTDRARMEKERKLEKDLKLLTHAAEHNPWVKKSFADLERKLRKYGSLTARVRAICQKQLTVEARGFDTPTAKARGSVNRWLSA